MPLMALQQQGKQSSLSAQAHPFYVDKPFSLNATKEMTATSKVQQSWLEEGQQLLTTYRSEHSSPAVKKNQNKPKPKTILLVFSASESRTSPRHKLLGITFPNHSKMLACRFLLVAMVSDDRAQDGYNMRQRAGNRLSRDRRDPSGGRREGAAHGAPPAVADLGGKVSSSPWLCKCLVTGACVFDLHIRTIKTIFKMRCFLNELKDG